MDNQDQPDIQPLQLYSLPDAGDPITYSQVVGLIGDAQRNMTEQMSVQKNSISSANFVTGVQGWTIDSQGNVEFNNGTFRGSITGSSINIPNATNPLFSVTSAGVLTAQNAIIVGVKMYTDLENSARFQSATGGTGTVTFNTVGAQLNTTVVGIGFSSIKWFTTPNSTITNGLKFFATVSVSATVTNTASAYIGVNAITVTSTGHTFTGNHIGFKILINSTSAILYATQATGGVETATMLTTVIASGVLDLYLVVNPTSVNYYYRDYAPLTDASWVKTTVNTTPTSGFSQGIVQVSLSNENTSTAAVFGVTAMGVER